MKSLKLRKLLHWVQSTYSSTLTNTEKHELKQLQIPMFVTKNSYRRIKNGLLEIAVKGEFNEPVNDEKKNRVYVMFKSKDRVIENDLDPLIEYILRTYNINHNDSFSLNTKRDEIRNTHLFSYETYIEHKSDILHYTATIINRQNRHNRDSMVQTSRRTALEYNNFNSNS